MKRIFLISLGLLALLLPNQIFAQVEEFHYTVQKLWDNNNYDAFTSLVKFKGKYYCSFREGRGHVFDENGNAEGKIRILCSKDGKTWTSVHVAGESGYDFRDPEMSVTPDGKLMVSIGVCVYREQKLVEEKSSVFFSKDGVNFTKPNTCNLEGRENHKDDWIWRVTWYNGVGYTANYYMTKEDKTGLCLMTTKDGINYTKHADLNVPENPNETTIRFTSTGKMVIIARRDGEDFMGFLGTSEAPYNQFDWKKLPIRLGGPDFVLLDDNTILLGSRAHYIPDNCTTSVFRGSVKTGKFEQMCVMPSNGDTGYPGLIIDGDELWMSFHAGRNSWPHIYLAKIPLTMFK